MAGDNQVVGGYFDGLLFSEAVAVLSFHIVNPPQDVAQVDQGIFPRVVFPDKIMGGRVSGDPVKDFIHPGFIGRLKRQDILINKILRLGFQLGVGS